MVDNFEQEARREAEARWPAYFNGAVGERELQRWEAFVAGAQWAREQTPEVEPPVALLERADRLKELTGMSLHQVARAIGLSTTREIYSHSPRKLAVERLADFEVLVTGLKGIDAKERGAELFRSSDGPSIYSTFCHATAPKGEKLHNTLSVRERLGVAD